LARLLAPKLSAALGQAVIVENRPGGAAGSVGVKTVAGAASDGYTLLLLPVDAFVQAPLVFKDIDYDPIKSFAPVASLVTSPYVVVVNPALPVRFSGARRLCKGQSGQSRLRISGARHAAPSDWRAVQVGSWR
jgi:tripartite-type tricarboxylate transporter receptor subunit TctC